MNISTVHTHSAPRNQVFPRMPNVPKSSLFFEFFRHYTPHSVVPREFESKLLSSQVLSLVMTGIS